MKSSGPLCLLFFINHPKIDLTQVEPTVEFLHNQRFEQTRIIIGEDTEVYLHVPQPDLSLEGLVGCFAAQTGRGVEGPTTGRSEEDADPVEPIRDRRVFRAGRTRPGLDDPGTAR